MKLTQKKLKELLYYDPLTGVFTWKERTIGMFQHCKYPEVCKNSWNTRFSGIFAGNRCKRGNNYYIEICITLEKKKERHLIHRLAFLYMTGSFPLFCIDHIDQNGLNNSWENLREVTSQENSKNSRISSVNTSGYTGVSWHKKSQKWRAHICIDGKDVHGGLFAKKEDAVEKRKQMSIEYEFHKNHGSKSVQSL